MAGGEPSSHEWDSIQTKLRDLSDAIHLLPQEQKAKALGDLENLTTSVKGSLTDCSTQKDTGREWNVRTNAVETESNHESTAIVTVEQKSATPQVRRSRRQCHVKRDADFIMEMPGNKSSKIRKKSDAESVQDIINNEAVKLEEDLIPTTAETILTSLKLEHEGMENEQEEEPGENEVEMCLGSQLTEELETTTQQLGNIQGNDRLAIIQHFESTEDDGPCSEDVQKKLIEVCEEQKNTSKIESSIDGYNGMQPVAGIKVEQFTEPVTIKSEDPLPEIVQPVIKSKKSRCLVCRRKFADKDTLREHMQNVHKIKIELKNSQKTAIEEIDQGVPIKRENSDTLQEVTSIKAEMSSEDKSQKLEPEDSDSAVRRLSEEEHVDGGQMFQCELCDKKLSKEIGLKQHMSRFHLKDLPTQCEICHKTYDTYKNLLSHRRIVHGGKRFFCDQCNYTTKHSLDLKRHMIRCHGSVEDYPYECEKCHKRFITTTTLRKHSEVHREFRPQQNCSYEGCGFVTRSTMSMTVHVRNKHLGKQRYFDCEICGKRLGAKSTYDTHLRRHRGQYIFKCSKCPASFPCRTQLAAHIRIHGDKTEECPVCGKKFNAKAKVLRHMMIHSGEKKYSCPLCVYKCNLDSNLRKHCIARHNIEYPPKRKPVYQLHSADEGERLRQGGISTEYQKLGDKSATTALLPSQKVEVMLQGATPYAAVSGQLDSEELLHVLQNHGFTGNETLQVEVGGQTYLINQGTDVASDLGNQAESFNGNVELTKPVAVLEETKAVEESGENVPYQMTFPDTAVRLTGVAPESGGKKKGFLKLVTSSGPLNDADVKTKVDDTTTLNIVAPEYDNVDISDECVLSEETIQQISSAEDSNTIIVIQKPNDFELKPTLTTAAATTGTNVEYLSTTEKNQFLSIGKHHEDNYELKSIDAVNHVSEAGESALDYGFVTAGSGAAGGRTDSWASDGLEVDQVIVSSVENELDDAPTLVIVGGEQSVLQ